MPGKDWGLRRVGTGDEYCVRWYVAISAEVLAQHAIVGLADFAFLDRTVSTKATEVTVRRYTYHKLKVFAECEADYSKHSLELIVWIIDASEGEYGGDQERRKMDIRGK